MEAKTRDQMRLRPYSDPALHHKTLSCQPSILFHMFYCVQYRKHISTQLSTSSQATKTYGILSHFSEKGFYILFPDMTVSSLNVFLPTEHLFLVRLRRMTQFCEHSFNEQQWIEPSKLGQICTKRAGNAKSQVIGMDALQRKVMTRKILSYVTPFGGGELFRSND